MWESRKEFHVRVEGEDYQRLEQVAAGKGLSLSHLIRGMISSWLQEHGYQPLQEVGQYTVRTVHTR